MYGVLGVVYSKLSSMHFYGWKVGLKTGMYYLRTKAAANAVQFTLPVDAKPASPSTNPKYQTPVDDAEACASCSA